MDVLIYFNKILEITLPGAKIGPDFRNKPRQQTLLAHYVGQCSAATGFSRRRAVAYNSCSSDGI